MTEDERKKLVDDLAMLQRSILQVVSLLVAHEDRKACAGLAYCSGMAQGLYARAVDDLDLGEEEDRWLTAT